MHFNTHLHVHTSSHHEFMMIRNQNYHCHLTFNIYNIENPRKQSNEVVNSDEIVVQHFNWFQCVSKVHVKSRKQFSVTIHIRYFSFVIKVRTKSGKIHFGSVFSILIGKSYTKGSNIYNISSNKHLY